MTEDYKPTSTRHLWVAAGLVGAIVAFFPMLAAIIILEDYRWFTGMSHLVVALLIGSYGGAISRHIIN